MDTVSPEMPPLGLSFWRWAVAFLILLPLSGVMLSISPAPAATGR
ncbi:MAG: hypothetical protein R3E89_16200 [Thiolinea sp.]